MSLIAILIGLLVAACVSALFYVGLNAIPWLPPWVKIVVVLIAIIAFLLWLMGALTGHSIPLR